MSRGPQRANLKTRVIEQRIGTRLRALRLALDLRRVDLARSAEVSDRTVDSLERGRGATLSTLLAVLMALGDDDPLSELFRPSDRLTALRCALPRQRAPRRPKPS